MWGRGEEMSLGGGRRGGGGKGREENLEEGEEEGEERSQSHTNSKLKGVYKADRLDLLLVF